MSVDVEKIVREVLARLNAESMLPKRAITSTPTTSVNAAELALDGKVVTLEHLRGKLGGIQVVSIQRGAIVTPAVRDLLKEKKVELSWRVVGANRNKPVASQITSVVLGLAETNYEPVKLIHSLNQLGATVVRLANVGLAAVIGELTDEVAKNGQTGLLLTSQTVAAVCLANRIRGVRAVTGESRAKIASAVIAVGANLLVLDPAKRGEWEVKQIVADFVRGAPRKCPEGLKHILI